MKTLAFADTGFWIALVNPRDSAHEIAKEFVALDVRPHLVTTEMILVEVLNYFCERGPALRRVASSFVQRLYVRPVCRIVPQTNRMFSEALDLYARRADKEWSLTDCASMCVMKDLGIRDVVTFDRHFEQAGFTVLFR